ncbi:RNA polymerase sigma factor sigC [Olea europaea subsp. europaea]|uniref:RNA polymerase sigma factor sigC n=1 Tax=Olea europaea subsp. europaea TaxID=158383 RepID=A0A8S0RV47_OLEEU|nr:RNA polymerase sigma factor sigC [Olea europaea subsp. europaea]
MGFRLDFKSLSVQSLLSTSSSSSLPSSYSCRGKGRESTYLTKLPITSVIYGETEALIDPLGPRTCLTSPQILEDNYFGNKEIKMDPGKQSRNGLYSLSDDNIQMSAEEDKLPFLISLQATEASHFSLLMKNLDNLEKMFSDSDVITLERDILQQLKRLGALRLFHTCLSRALKSSTLLDLSDGPTELVEETRINEPVTDHEGKVVVQSGKKEQRRLRRKRALEKGNDSSMLEFSSKTIPGNKISSRRRHLISRKKKLKITKNEAEMSSGVKLVADLEKVRTMLEEETGQVGSLNSWAEAARVEKKTLQQRLHHGWQCRDELLRSTRSLVVFIAKNYRGLGVAFEDLIQAGNFGVLQGAERFDQSRGYKFSTYVQYWIRKSMSMLVARHARGVRIPFMLSKVINQVQKARKSLRSSHGKHPDDTEIAKFTGLSIAKITSASKCLRVVGSIDQKLGEGISAKYLEVMPDTSIMSPEETVMRQQMIEGVYTLLNGLETRERQVVILRFGVGNHQRKSLEEIGKLFCVSKEWIRKIERTALTKLRKNGNSLQNLSHYLYM